MDHRQGRRRRRAGEICGRPGYKQLQENFKSVFNSSRVQLSYKNEGDTRRLVHIQKQVLQDTGVVTGDVVKVYNKFWVEVKVGHGKTDAFASGPTNYKDQAVIDLLSGLQAGDSVTIAFNTDFERHRIVELRKNPPRRGKSAASASTKPAAGK